MRPHRRQPTRLPRPWDSPGKNTGVGCHFLLQCRKVKSESEVAQSYPTLSDPMDGSLPGSSVHGVFQARVLQWGAIAFSKELSTASLYYCYSEVQTGSNGTEIRGRTTDPSLNLFTEYLLCQSWWFLSSAPRSCSMRDTHYGESLFKSQCVQEYRGSNKIRDNRIYMYHSCSVTIMYFFEAWN